MPSVRTIRIESTGSPDVIQPTTVDLPEPGADEVRVRHTAIGVNFIDTYHRSGLYPAPVPGGLGLEGAGTVESLGSEVTGLAPGDRVAYCSGPIGAYAEAHVVKARRLVKIPDHLSDEHAAGNLLRGLTVQYMTRQIYRCGPGDIVLFHAGAGGVGQIAIQWLKHVGASVITTTGSDEKAEIARRLGADHVIMYRDQDVASRVREITDGKGVPVVYDGVGKATWEASLDCLQRRGLMVSFGNASGPVRDVDLGILSAKGSLFVTRPTLAHYTETTADLQRAADDFFGTIAAGGVSLADPTVYPLEEAAQAHRDLEARRTTGSVILKP